MLQLTGLTALKEFMIICITIGQYNPYEKPEIIAEGLIKELKKKIIRRVK